MLFLQALTLLLIGLKLAGHITWPWLAVFTPLLMWAVIAAYAIYAQKAKEERVAEALRQFFLNKGDDDNDD
jgi:acyl-coenzyme A synthetase/AMP-(fatty) acid ligase